MAATSGGTPGAQEQEVRLVDVPVRGEESPSCEAPLTSPRVSTMRPEVCHRAVMWLAEAVAVELAQPHSDGTARILAIDCIDPIPSGINAES